MYLFDHIYTFIFVVIAKLCIVQSLIQTFLISELVFDYVKNKVIMYTMLNSLEDIALTYCFSVRNEPLPPGSPALVKRDGKAFDFTKSFNRRLFDVNAKGLDIGVSCSNCGISGSINIDIDLEKWMGIPKG